MWKQVISPDHQTSIFQFDPRVKIYQQFFPNSYQGIQRLISLSHFHLNKNFLIADFGTTLSITKINAQGELIGGQLIPGLLTQLKSMEKATKNLISPNILDLPKKNFLINTQQAMLRGVYNSLLGAVQLAFNSDEDILILCGGDSNLMETILKSETAEVIMEPNLAMIGMISFCEKF